MAKEAKKSKVKKAVERAVLVTTSYRGVFFGYATRTEGETIQLKRARNCVYWPASNKGFLGLASEGPKQGAKVGAGRGRRTAGHHLRGRGEPGSAEGVGDGALGLILRGAVEGWADAGYGYGDGSGYGYGSGDGSGDGSGYGSGAP